MKEQELKEEIERIITQNCRNLEKRDRLLIQLVRQKATQEIIEDEIKFLEKHKFPLIYNKEIIERIEELNQKLNQEKK